MVVHMGSPPSVHPSLEYDKSEIVGDVPEYPWREGHRLFALQFLNSYMRASRRPFLIFVLSDELFAAAVYVRFSLAFKYVIPWRKNWVRHGTLRISKIREEYPDRRMLTLSG
ncbi:hypothetical protein Sjap_016755 [Stephania japonica]|uniref:Uncharacterized protein n=1 Tax=Stephania japonica TaxID=461633 RepID=A0AAP0I4V3_9MAGN